MADSILFNIFTPCFLVFLILLGKESDCHSSANIFNYPAEDPIGDFLLCRQCGADLADSGYIVNQLSPEAYVTVNQTLFGKSGVEVQVLTNPLGIQFSVITLSTANCIGITKDWHTEFSWFPGYAWKGCICAHCGGHLGWMFEPLKSATNDRPIPSSKGFYVLTLPKILSEAFANSLIVIPKSYRN